MASSNPTTGLGVASVVTLSASAVALTKVGSQVALSAGVTRGGNQYAVTLSLANSSATTLTVTTVDVLGNTVAQTVSPVFKSYNYPAFTGYNPVPGSINGKAYNAAVASVNASSGVITAHAVGQAIVEAQFPVYDNSLGVQANSGDPVMMIYAQVIVTVTP
jgi:hypothetical protein